MKKAVIVTLVGVNAALLLGLMLGVDAPKAQAQIIGARTDYLVLTGKVSKNLDAVYVIDVGKKRMIALHMDRTQKRLLPFRGARRLDKDFPQDKRSGRR